MCTTCGCDNYRTHSADYSKKMKSSQSAHPGEMCEPAAGTAAWLKHEKTEKKDE